MTSPKRSMARDAFVFLPAKLAEGILLMLVTSLYARIFTTDAVGLYRIVNTSIQFAYLVLSGWMANAVTRYAGDEVKKDKGRVLYSTTSFVYLLFLLGASAVLALLYAVTKEPVFLFSILMFASYTAFQILNSALVQLGKILPSVLLSLTSASLKLIVAYALVGSASSGYPSATPALAAAIVADGLAALIALFCLGIPRVFSPSAFSKPFLKTMLAFGVPLMGVSVSVGLLNVSDTYLIGLISGKRDVALYGQNYTIASSIFTMINAGVMRGVYPNLLGTWREHGKEKTLPQLNDGVRLYLLVALPAAFGLCAISTPLCALLFPPEYLAAAPVISLTALAMVLMGLTEYANKAYELEANTMPILQNSLLAAVVKIVSSAALLYAFGFLGAALGTLLAFTVYLLVTALRAKRFSFVFRVPVASFFRILAGALACFSAAFLVTKSPFSPIPQLVLSILAGMAAYVLVLVLSGEIRQEWARIKQRFHPH